MDVDSSANGSFFPKDTILSMPDSALKGASGDFLGLDSQNVDLNLIRSKHACTFFVTKRHHGRLIDEWVNNKFFK